MTEWVEIVPSDMVGLDRASQPQWGGQLSEAQVLFDLNRRIYVRSDVPDFGEQSIPAGSVWERLGAALAR